MNTKCAMLLTPRSSVETGLEILFEDNHLLAVNKPPLLATAGALPGEPSQWEICKQYLKQKYDKPGEVYLGIVSRLDRMVSGVLLFARTSKAAARLNQQFAAREVEKRYVAIVSDLGRLPTEGTLEHWVWKDDQRHRMVASRNHQSPEAQLAKLSYRKMGGTTDFSYLEIFLETGRKHQIRVQLSHMDATILGDRKYGSRTPFPVGIALHSQSLRFIHPVQKTTILLECQPPQHWTPFLNRIT